MSGFDVVIGNPPYVDSETMSREFPRVRHALAALYSTTVGNWDLYIPFVEKAVRVLGDRGIEALVTPSQIIASDYAAELQHLMLQHNLLVCHDFSHARPFKDAAVAVAILAVQNVVLVHFDENPHALAPSPLPLGIRVHGGGDGPPLQVSHPRLLHRIFKIQRRDKAQLDHESRGVIRRWKHTVHPSGTDR